MRDLLTCRLVSNICRVSKLPRWVLVYSAWALAFTGGFANVVGLLGFTHQAISHLTSTTSLLASAIEGLDRPMIFHYGAVLGSFLLGAIVSGFLIQDSTLPLGRRYGVALILESLMLCAAGVADTNAGTWRSVYLAACAAVIERDGQHL